MKALFKSFLLLLAALPLSCRLMAQDVTQYVDPKIGTAHSRWFFYTPAAVPHGMAKLAPSTNGSYGNAQGWEAVGYDPRHHSIEGFVHFHEWQAGGVSIMPATGELKVKPGLLEKPDEGYRSRFEHKNEIAEPGYYKVLLDDYKITAELTATQRVGFHKYTFPANNQSRIIFDIGNVQGESGPVTDASIRMVDDTHFEGFVTTNPKYVEKYDKGGRVSMYIYGEISRKPVKVGSFNKGGITQNSTEGKGIGAGLFLEYRTTDNEVIELKIGQSFTSIKNAQQNLKAEAATLTFDQARLQAKKIWQQELGKLAVEGKNSDDKVKFYTGLFHALLGRGIASDVNGDYPRHDGSIGRLPADKNGAFTYNFINTDAIWGGYWNLTQMWALAYPNQYTNFVHTQLEIYKQRGWFADGVVNSNFASGVGTNMVGLAIAAAYNIGLRDYDVNLAYEAVKKNELGYEGRLVGSGKEIDAFAGVKSIYNHGNQPNLHISWLFNFSGKPWLTQKWTRAICDEFYGVEPIHGYGYGQDEDQGQLGSWYVMAALGLFDVKGFTDSRPIVEIGSPLFEKATVQLGNGKTLRIETINQSPANVYVQSASFNGKPLKNCWLYRDELMRGGKLVFIMGAQLNTLWGVAVPPPSAQ
jgi:predicted alpha-1,2-mannosidase